MAALPRGLMNFSPCSQPHPLRDPSPIPCPPASFCPSSPPCLPSFCGLSITPSCGFNWGKKIKWFIRFLDYRNHSVDDRKSSQAEGNDNLQLHGLTVLIGMYLLIISISHIANPCPVPCACAVDSEWWSFTQDWHQAPLYDTSGWYVTEIKPFTKDTVKALMDKVLQVRKDLISTNLNFPS